MKKDHDNFASTQQKLMKLQTTFVPLPKPGKPKGPPENLRQLFDYNPFININLL